MTPEFNSFVAHIHAHPHDGTGYLVLADHLEESGRGDLADAIRFVIHHQGKAAGEPTDATAWLKNPEGPGRFFHPTTNHEAWYGNGIRSGGDGLHFVTPDHYVHLHHADPTDKLIRQYRDNQISEHPLSAAEEKREVLRQWAVTGGSRSGEDPLAARKARISALQELAFHHANFGNREVGLKLQKLLASRGEHFYVQGPGHSISRPTLLSGRGDVSLAVPDASGGYLRSSRQQPKGSPVRLSREGSALSEYLRTLRTSKEAHEKRQRTLGIAKPTQAPAAASEILSAAAIPSNLHSDRRDTPKAMQPVIPAKPAVPLAPDVLSQTLASQRASNKASYNRGTLEDHEVEEAVKLHNSGVNPIAIALHLSDARGLGQPIVPVHAVKRAVGYKKLKTLNEKQAFAAHLAAKGYTPLAIRLSLADRFGSKLPIKLSRSVSTYEGLHAAAHRGDHPALMALADHLTELGHPLADHLVTAINSGSRSILSPHPKHTSFYREQEAIPSDTPHIVVQHGHTLMPLIHLPGKNGSIFVPVGHMTSQQVKDHFHEMEPDRAFPAHTQFHRGSPPNLLYGSPTGSHLLGLAVHPGLEGLVKQLHETKDAKLIPDILHLLGESNRPLAREVADMLSRGQWFACTAPWPSIPKTGSRLNLEGDTVATGSHYLSFVPHKWGGLPRDTPDVRFTPLEDQ